MARLFDRQVKPGEARKAEQAQHVKKEAHKTNKQEIMGQYGGQCDSCYICASEDARSLCGEPLCARGRK